MGWNVQTETERDTLMSIVALLLALAELADRAAGASSPVRCRVVWALRQADAVASEFVTGGSQWPPAPKTSRAGFEPADAINLAQSLRLLALMVRNIAKQHGRTNHRGQFAFVREKSLAKSRKRIKVDLPLRRATGPP